MTHEPVELDEGAGIEQELDPLAGEQLAPLVLPRDCLLGDRVLGGFAQLAQPARASPRSSRAASTSGRSLTGHEIQTSRSRVLYVHSSSDRFASRVGRDDRPARPPATWPYEDGEPGRFSYARADHPTGVACEEELGRLDGGHALLYPSGMGGVTTVVLTMLHAGGRIALAEGAYYGHRVLFDHLQPWGVHVVEFDQTGPPPADVDLILVEAPANPLLTMPDLEAAAAHPAPVVCDATIASPLRLRPLELGCDVVAPLGDEGARRARRRRRRRDRHARRSLYDRLHLTRRLAGIVASADTAWLVHRGLETLEARLARQEASARVLAERLGAHPAVTRVRYPGFSFLVSFDVADGEARGRVERAVETIENATSLGGTRSKLEARHRWEGDRIPPGCFGSRSGWRTSRCSGPTSSGPSRTPDDRAAR